MKTQPYKLVAYRFSIHQQLKMQKEGEETSKPPDVTDTHIEPIPETEADQDPEAELPGDNYVAEIEDPVELENYTRITEIGEPIEEYTAEIDVELSESEEEDEASLKTQTEKEEESSPTSCSDVAYGNHHLKKKSKCIIL